MSSDKFQQQYRIPSARWKDWDYADEGAYFITICTGNRLHWFGKIENEEMKLSDIGQLAVEEWLKSAEMRPDMNLNMDIFCVMPNHIHAIVVIGKNEFNSTRKDAMNYIPDDNDPRRDAMFCVSINKNQPIRDAMFCVSINKSQPIRDAKHCVHVDNQIIRDAMHCIPDDNQIIRDAKHCVSTGNGDDGWGRIRSIENNSPANHFGPQSKNLAAVLRGFKSAVTMRARGVDKSFCWQTRFHDHVIRDDKEFRAIAHYIEMNVVNWGKDKYSPAE